MKKSPFTVYNRVLYLAQSIQACRYEIVPYVSEQNLEDMLCFFKLDVQVIGDEHKRKKRYM
tara:strand:+ start:215 stop:397 length:183 start_codon:yes stop_codon:yes gene_type:complete